MMSPKVCRKARQSFNNKTAVRAEGKKRVKIESEQQI